MHVYIEFFYVVPPLKVFDIVNLSWRAEKCLFIKIYVDFVQKLEHMVSSFEFSPSRIDCHKVLRRRGHSDIISNLPDNVIESILGRLPIRDAVRTSILSRSWRYKWTALPNLVFDVIDADRSIFRLNNNASQFEDDDELVKVIYRILCQHKSPILKFRLLIQSMRSYPDVDQWINFLSRNGIREINLECLKEDRYKIHSSLFSCANLRQLRLQHCVIPSPPPTFNGFNCLTRLIVYSVTVNNEGFENLVARCPQLNQLYLICVDGLDRLNIDHAPKLQSLLFVGSLKYICLKNTPSLSHVTISLSQLPDMNENLWNNGGSISLINNLDCLSNLKSIVAGFYSLKFLAECRARKRLPSTFIHLRSIYISMLMFEDVDSLSCVVGLITSSPNLHKLVVTTCTNSAAEMETATEYLEGESRSIGGLMKLRYVVMKQISGLGPEMELMKLILAKSPSLKQMKIEPDKTVDISSESRILKDLVRFPRASRIAEIIYQNQDHSPAD
ncbi:F-box/RNI-like superfamily protein [Theobroma cacao]|uniref:F-box/RNI-like superfamily protein n=1 Tax=Theobroma cacao TaxID=3641 RepID=A0A061E967_THECC|nr:F-box/RNI-like superfamily protein [Theobroma cacao]